ncbi:hypothetical protein ACLK1T_01590 [Escherichia coli]
MLFQLKTWGMAGDFPSRCAVSFVKLMAYGSIGVGSSFLPCVYFVSCNCVLFSASIVAGYGDDIARMPTRQPLKPGVTGIRQGLRHAPVVRQSFLLMNPVPAL